MLELCRDGIGVVDLDRFEIEKVARICFHERHPPRFGHLARLAVFGREPFGLLAGVLPAVLCPRRGALGLGDLAQLALDVPNAPGAVLAECDEPASDLLGRAPSVLERRKLRQRPPVPRGHRRRLRLLLELRDKLRQLAYALLGIVFAGSQLVRQRLRARLGIIDELGPLVRELALVRRGVRGVVQRFGGIHRATAMKRQLLALKLVEPAGVSFEVALDPPALICGALSLGPVFSDRRSHLLVTTVGGSDIAPAPLARDRRIVAVVLKKLADRLPRFDERLERGSLGLEVAKRLGDIGQDGLIERLERLGERPRQHLGVGALGKLRLPELQKEPDQRFVAIGAELKQPLIDGASIGRRLIVDLPAIAEGGLQAFFAERAVRRYEKERLAHPVRGDEKPAAHGPPGDRPKATADRDVLGPGLGHPAELEPGITLPVVVFAPEQKVPFHPLFRVAVGLDAGRTEPAVEQKRQGERHRDRSSRRLRSTMSGRSSPWLSRLALMRTHLRWREHAKRGWRSLPLRREAAARPPGR